MMKNCFKMICVVLVASLLCNMLPMSVFAEDLQQSIADQITEEVQEIKTAKPVIAEELVENRSEYGKQFRLSNGLFLAVEYPDAVHFQKSGSWEEIDNTLTVKDGKYMNTDGVWRVQFPQQISSNNSVVIEKDGYTLSFALSGQLQNTGLEIAGTQAALTPESAAETFQVSGMQLSTASVVELDTATLRESAEHPETVITKNRSALTYQNVFANTHIRYDLQSNTVKESIELQSYNSQLRGYRYTLNTGDMIPVLEQDNSIKFYTPDQKQVVMTMPAPFMLDANMAYCPDVKVTLTGKGSTYILTYLLPQSWLADSSRAWPVILDPVVQAPSDQSNVRDKNIYSFGDAAATVGVLQCGYANEVGISRAYLKYDKLPHLNNADVIVGAEVRMYKPNTSGDTRYVCVHKVLETWDEDTLQWSNRAEYDETVEDYEACYAQGYYTWDITDIARGWYEGENTGMMFKLPDSVEQAGVASYAQFWSAEFAPDQDQKKPTLFIYFRNNNGLEDIWDYTSSSAGRAGTGHVNEYTGNMVWVHSDIGFGGNRMPVSISHVYNANDCDNNTFGMGYGWRTNYNQQVYSWSENSDYYVWEDSDGTSHYFEWNATKNAYVHEDNPELTITDTGSGNSKYVISDENGNTSHFDTNGRLTKIENNQEEKSSINITYENDSGYLISQVTDGVGRVYDYIYTNGLLSRISYLGSNHTEHSYVVFTYTDSKLTQITDADAKSCTYTYNGNLLTQAQDIDGYKIVYTYRQTENEIDTEKPNRVIEIREYDGTLEGGRISIEYAHNQTTFTDHNGNTIIKQFNDFGDTTCIQDDEGHAQFAKYAFNTAADRESNTDATAKGNQLRLSSNMQNTVGNRLRYSSVETPGEWKAINSAITVTRSSAASKVYEGYFSAIMKRATAGAESGVYSDSLVIAPGETYTFSAYIKTGTGAAYLGIHDGTTTEYSDVLPANTEFTRLQVSYTNKEATDKTVTCRVLTKDACNTYIDCAQMEQSASASRYNLIENGDFRYAKTDWQGSTYTVVQSNDVVHGLESSVVKVVGNPAATQKLSQVVSVSGTKDEPLILSGWAKGDSAQLRGNRTFSMTAVFNYTDGYSSKTFRVNFNPDTNSTENWQYAAIALVPERAYRSVTVRLCYDYNVNTAYFDGIQLYKEEFGTTYTYDANGKVVSTVDLQKQETKYEYTGNDLTEAIMPNGVTYTYTYDDYHNVETATTSAGQTYNFTYDQYGNNTQVSITEAGETITSSATYTDNGNTLVSTTDALGKVTQYGYNLQTGVLEWVQYPEDTAATRTEYTYDAMYRMASAAADTDTGLNMSVSYTYTNDLLTQIETPTTDYNFTYGDFSLRESDKVGTQNLATYDYTDDGNFYLESLDYSNGDSVNYTYDDKGRVTEITYEDEDEVTYQYDNDGALAVVEDSATDMTTRYYYDFLGRMMKYTETADGYSHSVEYVYDSVNNLTTQVETINGVAHTTSYTYDQHNRLASKTTDGITVAYAYDEFGRVVTQTTKNGDATILTESYTYRANSSQVATYTTTIGGSSVTYSYTYDDNGNITKESSSAHDIEYVYDSANQLIAEYNTLGEIANTWVYDNAGNITYHNVYDYIHAEVDSLLASHDYTYGNEQWGDLLTSYDGDPIEYDDIGNPLDDCTWEYTWEHGRELSSMSDNRGTWTYAYNADGIRTKRTNGTRTYEYFYNGSQLVQLKVDGNTLFFTYDAQGTPTTVSYNGTLYYYITNLQGDVTAIVDANGTTQVAYTCNAYGLLTRSQGDLNSGIGLYNPLRYRGYVFDSETGLYYLQSRYYDPGVGRFINGDVYAATGRGFVGNNMFEYCNNNPVNMKDSTGNLPEWLEELKKAAEDAYEDAMEKIEEVISTAGQIIGDAVEYLDNKINGTSEKLSYQSNGKNQGAKIENSYKITDPVIMAAYIKKNNNGEIAGTTFGAVYEWGVHNVAFYGGNLLKVIGLEKTGNDIITRAKDLDIGSTIYDDDHNGCSLIMWGIYATIAPTHAIIDGIIECLE